MPELPDIELYLHALRPRVLQRAISRVRVLSPFVLRTFEPPIEAVEGRTVRRVGRIGKTIDFDLGDGLHLVVHLMIAGRFRWFEGGRKPPAKIALMTAEFDGGGTLVLVESSTQKRAAVYVVQGEAALKALDPGGIDVIASSREAFAARLLGENHTLKRALTDPRLFDGIGNAYSDEILHAAGLSPLKRTANLDEEEITRLHDACRTVLTQWTARLQAEFGTQFPGPGDVTAFRPDFAAHGKFGQPCPVCGTKIQRIRYENETNYCPRCQTQGVVLADRSLSRLLKDDWPRRIEDWE